MAKVSDEVYFISLPIQFYLQYVTYPTESWIEIRMKENWKLVEESQDWDSQMAPYFSLETVTTWNNFWWN